MAFLGLACALALGLGHLPGARARYPDLFHAHAAPILRALTGRPVLLAAPEAADAAAPGVDTVMKGYLPGVFRPAWISRFSVVRIGYWPSAVLLALILATPMSAARRTLALLASVALIDALALARIGVEIAYAYAELERGPGQAAGGVGHLLLRVGSESLTATIPSGAAVLLLWVLLADPRRGLDLAAVRGWLGLAAPAAAGPTPPGDGAARPQADRGQREPPESP